MKINLTNVNYLYNQGTISEKNAVRDVTLSIEKPEFIAIVGSTGSGKSTLIQLLNGLKLPTSGTITYDGVNIGKDKKQLRDIRCKVGIVFQYPEYQLFDENVLKDAAFGPHNKGCSNDEAIEKAKNALLATGMTEESFDKSPFDLSGGEKRRVAIAGVIAMDPEILIMDEPTAGLDPKGKSEILDLINELHKARNMTVIMVSHNMDEVAEYADRVIVMHEGQILMDGDPHDVFANEEIIKQAGLNQPQAADFCKKLGIDGPIKINEAADAIAAWVNK